MELKYDHNPSEELTRDSVFVDDQSLDKMPPVAMLRLEHIKTYSIEDPSDAERFTKGLEPPDPWIARPEDDLASVIPRLLMGLQYAVKNFCSTLPGVYFEYFGIESKPDKRTKILLYRCVCELVNNALKHAGATNVFVQLIMEGELTAITVHDNGTGFDPETAAIGAGFANICSCVLALNGQMNIYSSPSEGTEISIEIASHGSGK
ncbi:MAG: hypothetical protein LBQ73_10025 [Tannerellaceae bacterium]|jgi:hypothetical protein|nr:hypothetical protein [Tannerellaceae bacterium]